MEPNDFVVCRECKGQFKSLTFHLPSCCDLTTQQYKLKYPSAPLRAECVNKKVSDAYKDPNSGFNTPKHKELRRQRALNNWSDGGRWRTEECSQRRSVSVKAAWNRPGSIYRTEQHFQKRSETLVKRWQNPEDGIGSEKTNKKRSRSMKLLWGDPNSNMNTDEANAKRSESVSAIWAQPNSPYRTEEVRQRRSEGIKRAMASEDYDWTVFHPPTSIEIKMQELLDNMKLPYKREFRIGRYAVDFLIGDKFILEVFGDYWHGPERPEQQIHDEKRLDWLEEQGYDTLVIWQHEINNESERCKAMIENHIAEFGY